MMGFLSSALLQKYLKISSPSILLEHNLEKANLAFLALGLLCMMGEKFSQ